MQRWLGVGILAGSAVAYSLAGFFTRLIPLDAVTLLFWRGLFAGVFILLVVWWRYGRQAWPMIRAIGWPGFSIAVMGSLSSYIYLSSLRLTTVADVAVIYATLPFVTAALAWVALREREGWRVLVGSLAALGGIAVMAGGALRSGHLLGDALAFGMTLTYAAMIVLIRRGRHVSMMPAVGIQCLVSAAAAAPFAKLGPLESLPLLHLALFGTCQLGLGLMLLSLGMRRVPATQAALISLLDTPLAPLWVWLAFSETPPAATLVGGTVIIAAVGWTILGSPRPTVLPPVAEVSDA
jgi:drug/metabolite transporter (DMT)-like permease